MKTITVNASKKYDVIIGAGLLESTAELIKKTVSGKTAFVISDDNVFPLYGNRLFLSLQKGGYKTYSYVFKSGESSKNLTTYSSILEKMCESGLTRSDFVIALGGGVTGDLAGFAAATYQRGIDFIQLPTTLLAAVDSSVGGKTGVDLKSGKNQVGCFCQPSLVICDTELLHTLNEAEYENGCAEIIKYAVLGSKDLFDSIKRTPVKAQYEEVIAECVNMKRQFVEADEFDGGLRMMLNLGHTIGHAVETLSKYKTAHGRAVAMGLCAICRAALKKEYISKDAVEEIINLVLKYNLPAEIPYKAAELESIMMNDKKGKGDYISLVIPEQIGKCSLIKTNKSDLLDWLRSGGIE